MTRRTVWPRATCASRRPTPASPGSSTRSTQTPPSPTGAWRQAPPTPAAAGEPPLLPTASAGLWCWSAATTTCATTEACTTWPTPRTLQVSKEIRGSRTATLNLWKRMDLDRTLWFLLFVGSFSASAGMHGSLGVRKRLMFMETQVVFSYFPA